MQYIRLAVSGARYVGMPKVDYIHTIMCCQKCDWRYTGWTRSTIPGIDTAV